MANSFTPEQISQILEEFFKVVGTRQYIGARYVPIFGRKGEESIEWDNSAPYEPLTIVLYQGNSYTSRQYVPVGVEITNQEFWAITGNYNAQVEAYRQEVRYILPYDETPTEGSTKGVTSDGIKKAVDAAVNVETTRATAAEKSNSDAIATNSTAIASNTAMLNATTQSPLKSLVDANTTANSEHTNMLAGTVDSGLKSMIDAINPHKFAIIGDSWADGWNGSTTITSFISLIQDMTGYTPISYHEGGAGWIAKGKKTGKTYVDFVSQLISEHGNDSFSFIIIQGSLNDLTNNNAASIINAAKASINSLKSTFHCTIYYALTPRANRIGFSYYKDLVNLNTGFGNMGCVTFDDLTYSLLWRPDIYANDWCHLTDYAPIARYLVSHIFGGGNGFVPNVTANANITVNNNSHVSDPYGQLLHIGHKVILHGAFTLTGISDFKNGTVTDTRLFSIPNQFAPMNLRNSADSAYVDRTINTVPFFVPQNSNATIYQAPTFNLHYNEDDFTTSFNYVAASFANYASNSIYAGFTIEWNDDSPTIVTSNLNLTPTTWFGVDNVQ